MKYLPQDVKQEPNKQSINGDIEKQKQIHETMSLFDINI